MSRARTKLDPTYGYVILRANPPPERISTIGHKAGRQYVQQRDTALYRQGPPPPGTQRFLSSLSQSPTESFPSEQRDSPAIAGYVIIFLSSTAGTFREIRGRSDQRRLVLLRSSCTYQAGQVQAIGFTSQVLGGGGWTCSARKTLDHFLETRINGVPKARYPFQVQPRLRDLLLLV